MSHEESDHFAKTTPENTIPTNMLDKWKLQDDGTVVAKSRSVLVGWKDPVIYQLERAAPTPTQEGIMVTFQWDSPQSRSDQRVRTGSQDVKKNKLATKLPPGVTQPKEGPRQLLRVETALWTCVRAKLVEGWNCWMQAMSKIRTTNACSHCSLPMRHRKANCCSMLTTS